MLSKKKSKIEQETRRIYIEPLLWIPGNWAKHDLKGTFSKPHIPLGEAWFLGGPREMYTELNAHGVAGIADSEIEGYLYTTIRGMSIFSLMPEWAEWFGYLFSYAVEKPEIFNKLCCGLMLLGLTSSKEPVANYEGHFASILAAWIMQPEFWRGVPDNPTFQKYEQVSWLEFDLDAELAISLFLCWRYLKPEAIGPWLHSVLAIEDPQWRGQILLWFLEVLPIFEAPSAQMEFLHSNLTEKLWPESGRWVSDAYYYFEQRKWEFIAAANVEALREAIRAEFSEAVYLEWIERLSAETGLWSQLELVMERFGAAYLS